MLKMDGKMTIPSKREMASAIFTFVSENYINSASTHQIKAALKKAGDLITLLSKEDEAELEAKDCANPAIKEGIKIETPLPFAAPLTKEEGIKIGSNNITLPFVTLDLANIKNHSNNLEEINIKTNAKEITIFQPEIKEPLEKKPRKPRSDKGIKRK